MSDFRIAYLRTLRLEGPGTLTKDPLDPGGETCCGISRTFHPEWEGWADLDHGVPVTAIYIQQKLEAFYKKEFWDLLQLTYVSDQNLSNEIYDNAVNCGPHEAILWLQRALNIIHLDAPELKEDGVMGTTTFSTVNNLLLPQFKILIRLMEAFQVAYYISDVTYHPQKRRFLIGWLNNRITW